MSPQAIFFVHLALGYVAWILVFRQYLFPRLASFGTHATLRAIAAFHSFRFFGLIFMVPGLVGSGLPSSFGTFAAYGDFATGVLAMFALLFARTPGVFWFFVVAFNVVGTVDFIVDYIHGVQIGLGDFPGQLGLGYPIVILYVPALMITHVVAFYLLFAPARRASTKHH